MLVHCPAPNLGEDRGYWQRNFSLQTWQISVRVVPASELGPDIVGDMHIERAGVATVRILREQDSDLPRCRARADEELTLLHELVHLKRRVAGEDCGEVAIVAETTEIVRAYHRSREAAAIEGFRPTKYVPGTQKVLGSAQEPR